MTLSGVIALFCLFSPNSIALLANYVTVVEERHNDVRKIGILSPSSSLPLLTDPPCSAVCDGWHWYNCLLERGSLVTSHVHFNLSISEVTFDLARLWKIRGRFALVRSTNSILYNTSAIRSTIVHTCSSKIATHPVTHLAILVVLTILRQSRRDPGIGNSTIPNPGIEKSSPGLQSLVPRTTAVSEFPKWPKMCRVRR